MSIAAQLIVTLTLLFSFNASGQNETSIKAPNLTTVSDKLVTAGQPTAESLATLSQLGFKAVIYLAPPTVPDAVSNEAQIIRDQGLEFINIPIQWTKPTEEDFIAYADTMKRLQGKKIFVHCQANMRASAMTFLYRVIVMKEDPNQAYETVLKVWVPNSIWRGFINTQLKKANIAFEVK